MHSVTLNTECKHWYLSLHCPHRLANISCQSEIRYKIKSDEWSKHLHMIAATAKFIPQKYTFFLQIFTSCLSSILGITHWVIYFIICESLILKVPSLVCLISSIQRCWKYLSINLTNLRYSLHMTIMNNANNQKQTLVHSTRGK